MLNILVGQRYNVRCAVRDLCTGNTSPYPYWHNKIIPIKVLQEYKNFYVVTTLKHSGSMFGPAKPYTTTIDKFDIETNRMIISEYNKKEANV